MPADPSIPRSLDPNVRLAERIAALEGKVRDLSSSLQGGSVPQFPVVNALPTAGRLGRAVVLSTDGKLYLDNGSAWVPQT